MFGGRLQQPGGRVRWNTVQRPWLSQAEAGMQPALHQPRRGPCGCQRTGLVLISAQNRCPRGTLEASVATVQDSFSRRRIKSGKKFGQKRTSLGEEQERNCPPRRQFCVWVAECRGGYEHVLTRSCSGSNTWASSTVLTFHCETF